jgi:hypothetical protein
MHCTTQVGLQALIQSFRLTIRLGMVRRTHDQLSVREFKQLLPHIIQENVIMIRNDSMWKSMQAIDMVKVYLSHLQGSEGVCKWKKVRVLGEFINDH